MPSSHPNIEEISKGTDGGFVLSHVTLMVRSGNGTVDLFRIDCAKAVKIHSRHILRRTGAEKRFLRELIASATRVASDCSHACQT